MGQFPDLPVKSDVSGVHCRNIFSDKKYVEEYRLSDLQSELGLDQVC